MSSVIEVLKEARKDIRSCLHFNQDDYYKGVCAHVRLDNALDEALLALEQLGNIVKELKHLEMIAGAEELTDSNFFNAVQSYRISLEKKVKEGVFRK